MEELRQSRIKAGYSQKRLVEELKLSINYISMLENGRKNPSPGVAKKICNILNKEFDDIFYIIF